MDAEAEAMRQQVEETKSQLVEKLETLEQQVSDTVQSTGAAVNATVESVSGTVESVTGAIQDTMKSVGGVFDVRSHVKAHPWLTLGGSLAFGFLMARHFSRPRRAVPVTVTGWPQDGTGQTAQPEVVAAAVRAAYESGLRVNSPVRQLQTMAMGALVGVAQDVVSRAANEILRQVSERFASPQNPVPEASDSPSHEGQLQIHCSEGVCSDNPLQVRRQTL